MWLCWSCYLYSLCDCACEPFLPRTERPEQIAFLSVRPSHVPSPKVFIRGRTPDTHQGTDSPMAAPSSVVYPTKASSQLDVGPTTAQARFRWTSLSIPNITSVFSKSRCCAIMDLTNICDVLFGFYGVMFFPPRQPSHDPYALGDLSQSLGFFSLNTPLMLPCTLNPILISSC